MNDAERLRLVKIALESKKEDCPDCYKRWLDKGYIRLLTKKEVESLKHV